MKLVQSILKNNPCYKAGKKITVKGLMLHSVGCPQPKASVFINSWNKASYNKACVHAFIDGNDGVVEQSVDAVGHMGLSLLVVDDVAGEKHLRAIAVVFGEEFVIHKHQLALTDGSHSLTLGNIGGALGDTQTTQTDTDGAGGHQHDLATAVGNICKNTAKPVDTANIGLAAFVGDGGGAHLYHNSCCMRSMSHCNLNRL